MDHFKKYLATTKLDVQMEYLADQQLLALQGKGAKTVAAKLIRGIDISKMPFMTGVVATVAGIHTLFDEITSLYLIPYLII